MFKNLYSLSEESSYGLGTPLSYQITFQQPASPIAEGIFVFHDDLILFLIGILGFVLILKNNATT